MGAVQPHRRMRCARDHTAVYGAGASQALSMEQARALRHRGRRRARMTPREFCLLDTRNDWLYQCPLPHARWRMLHAPRRVFGSHETQARDVRPDVMSAPPGRGGTPARPAPRAVRARAGAGGGPRARLSVSRGTRETD